MNLIYALQISSLLEVIPPWLPPAAITSGFILVSVGMFRKYFEGLFGHWRAYSPSFIYVSILSFALSIGGAVYVTIQRHELVLMFVFFIFMSGRIIQGAITARLLQKVLDFFFSGTSDSNAGLLIRIYGYAKTKLKERAILFIITGIITLHTTFSIIAVYVIGSGKTIEAIERFWIGFFFLTVAGIVFDFRHFAHRISWTAAFGLVLAVSGAFLYSPLGFSGFTNALAPYLQNPIPDWMRWPLGAVGFIFGVLLWAVFYVKEG